MGDFLQDFSLTYSVLKTLDQLTEAPVTIELRSCYSGSADKDVVALKPGSKLITFTDPKYFGVTGTMPSAHLMTSLPDSGGRFLHYIRDSGQTLNFNIHTKNGPTGYTYIPFGKKIDIEEVDELIICITRAEQQFIDFCNKQDQCFISDYPAPITPQEATTTYCKKFLMYEKMIGSPVTYFEKICHTQDGPGYNKVTTTRETLFTHISSFFYSLFSENSETQRVAGDHDNDEI